MKLTQLFENFVISNDEFEDYLNRATEQLVSEIQGGKNPRDTVHDLSVQFSKMHNSAYAAYQRMSDGLSSRMFTLDIQPQPAVEPELDMGTNDFAGPDMPIGGNEFSVDEPEIGPEPQQLHDPMGNGMEIELPSDELSPTDADMDAYGAVMDNYSDDDFDFDNYETSKGFGESTKKKIDEFMPIAAVAGAARAIPGAAKTVAKALPTGVNSALKGAQAAAGSTLGKAAIRGTGVLTKATLAAPTKAKTWLDTNGASGGIPSRFSSSVKESDGDDVDVATEWNNATSSKRNKWISDWSESLGKDWSKAKPTLKKVVYLTFEQLNPADQEYFSVHLKPIISAQHKTQSDQRSQYMQALETVGEDTLDAMAARHKEILGFAPFEKGQNRFTDTVAVAGITGIYNSSLDPSLNKASRKVFEEFTGTKLPKTLRDTKEFIKVNAPFTFRDPQK